MILTQIYARYMVCQAYLARRLPIVLTQREARVLAHTYTSDRARSQIAGKLDYNTTVKLIRNGHSISGEGRHYLSNTIHHLRQLGLPLTSLKSLLKAANAEG